MSELQHLYEIINGTSYDRRNFHKKMMATGFIADEGPNPNPEQSRTATMYSFKEADFIKQEQNKEMKKYPFDF